VTKQVGGSGSDAQLTAMTKVLLDIKANTAWLTDWFSEMGSNLVESSNRSARILDELTDVFVEDTRRRTQIENENVRESSYYQSYQQETQVSPGDDQSTGGFWGFILGIIKGFALSVFAVLGIGVVVNSASVPGSMGWNQAGYIFGNGYIGMVDPNSTLPSKTLSRIYSTNNCYINQQGTNMAFLKHWVNGSESITGYSHSTAQTAYGINGTGDLFPTDTSLSTHFTNPNTNDFSVKAGSPCAGISNIGLTNPSIFAD
jgi:hypothetical protein